MYVDKDTITMPLGKTTQYAKGPCIIAKHKNPVPVVSFSLVYVCCRNQEVLLCLQLPVQITSTTITVTVMAVTKRENLFFRIAF